MTETVTSTVIAVPREWPEPPDPPADSITRNAAPEPASRRMYGLWLPENQSLHRYHGVWLEDLGGHVYCSEYPQVMAAQNHNERDQYEVREIGADGLPVPVTP